MNAAAAPYQRPSHGHSASYGGPPPAKKVKGNPIITRYPPPPGYKPPAQAPYMAGYGLPVAWQGQNYVASAVPCPTSHMPANAPQYAFPPTYGQSMEYLQYQHARSHSVSSVPMSGQGILQGLHHSTPSIPGIVFDGNGDPMSPSTQTEMQDNALEHDFDEECFYSRHPEQIDPSLSLGAIVWKAPVPGLAALPATFGEAGLGATAPRIATKANGKSLSALCDGEEPLLSVRQTEAWFDLQRSLIFKEFPAVCHKLISLSELLTEYKQRFDEEWAVGPRSPTPGLTREPTPVRTDSRASSCGRSVDSWHQDNSVRPSTEQADAFDNQLDVLDRLEAALRTGSRNGGSVAHSRAGSVGHSRAGSVSHSRAGSVHSHHRRQSSTIKFTRPKVLQAVRDPAQEDILAALGVSGSPKSVYQTPGPAFGPPPESKTSRHSRESSVASTRSTTHVLQPVIPEELDTPRKPLDQHMKDTPLQLAIIEDIEPDDDVTPRPLRWQRDNMRKRSYADSQGGAQRGDEETPKRSKPYYTDPNGR
ncbi:hypothetical protein CERZMDRAFT_80982 [Cercospora zeae-maydis SCOH1-5]|uniref:Uncharacterized protein n=1 Tax=Cercospora zeae-maydis SCOH1-5 TaxID=717836 RepID=A0A6A6FU20_9PEZI|nr:hypothetical protein CERZMDRAFT_80982 [Cercospora zeae-maydis SCOH1-5]